MFDLCTRRSKPGRGFNKINTGIGTQGKAEADVDGGRKNVTKADTDWAAFKPPSLRNVAASPPYFHDGSAATLEQVVTIYNTRLALGLTAQEVQDVAQYLKSL